jgi:hypothetical protein
MSRGGPDASSDRTTVAGTTGWKWEDTTSFPSIGRAIPGTGERSWAVCRSRRWRRSRRYSQPRTTLIAIAAGTPTPIPILADVGKPLSLVEGEGEDEGDAVGAPVSAAELEVVEAVEAAKMVVYSGEIEADVEEEGGEVTRFVWLVEVDVGFPLGIRSFMKIPCPA